MAAAGGRGEGGGRKGAVMERNHYEVLEVKQDDTLKDIKKAYRRLAVLHHPDRNLGNKEGATVRFREVNEAYQVLSDDALRKEYDASLRRGGANSFSGGSGHDGANNYNWTYQSRGGGATAAALLPLVVGIVVIIKIHS